MTKPTIGQVETWLAILATGYREFDGIDKKEARMKLRPIVVSMIKTYDAEVFCDAAREAIASTMRFWGEADIRQRLDTWISVNIRSPHALPIEAEEAPVGQPAKIWLAFWFRANTEDKAVRALDLIRTGAFMDPARQEAWDHLTLNDTRAASIAVYRKWLLPTRASLTLDWDDEAAIRARVHPIMALDHPPGDRMRLGLWRGAMTALTAIVAANAPQHLPALIDEMRSFQDGRAVQSGATEAMAPVPVAFPLGDAVDPFGE